MSAVAPAVEQARPASALEADRLSEYLADCRQLVIEEMRTFVPADGPFGPVLYDLVFDYPLRAAKALRPALCIATCRALGGNREAVLRTAAVLELYHNAFLVHDDVEDGSDLRRASPTLHRMHGVPIAINVGDAMLALALRPLLDNIRLLGLGRALRILEAVTDMAIDTVEGQALELAWIRRGVRDLEDRAYLRLVYKKTTCYTFLAPMKLGAIAAGADARVIERLKRIAICLGAAFQIQDDILNLEGDEGLYGKEQLGDLWEGKHTLILTHALRHARPAERAQALAILAKARPAKADLPSDRLRSLIASLEVTGEIASGPAARLLTALEEERPPEVKTEADVRWLHRLILAHGSIAYARSIARQRALRAQRSLGELADALPDSVHLRFIEALIGFTLDRQS
jgi:geranylgeranyl diphosphate synthase type II